MNPATAEKLKKFSPWIIGGVVGLFVLYKYAGGGSSGGTDYAAYYAAQSAQNAQAGALQLQNKQLDAAIASQNMQNQTAQIGAVGSSAATIASGIAQVIAAQSILPAQAMNAASQSNQIALASAASVAGRSFDALPGMFSGIGDIIGAGYSPFGMYGASLVGLQSGVNAAGAAAVNGVASSANSAVGATASAAQAASAANAQATASGNNAASSMFGSAASTAGLMLMFM
jgi:hypothetical protein